MRVNMQFDTIIIGAGPGGLAAGIYASRAELSHMLIERAPVSGGQIINTYEVDNYPGIPGIGGFALADKFRDHCDRLSVNFCEGEVKRISRHELSEDAFGFLIELEDGRNFTARTVIAATGAVNSKLGVKGEAELCGMGVSYCATCDGAFFKNKVTAVVGGGDVAVEDAVFLARLCKKVYLIHRRDEFRAARSLVSSLSGHENIEILYDTVVEKIVGNDQVESVRIRNVKTDAEEELVLSGVFIAVGIKPNSELFREITETDEKGWIIAGEDGKTGTPGLFAVGDVRTKQLRQVITAAADGANAITSVERYLASLQVR